MLHCAIRWQHSAGLTHVCLNNSGCAGYYTELTRCILQDIPCGDTSCLHRRRKFPFGGNGGDINIYSVYTFNYILMRTALYIVLPSYCGTHRVLLETGVQSRSATRVGRRNFRFVRSVTIKLLSASTIHERI